MEIGNEASACHGSEGSIGFALVRYILGATGDQVLVMDKLTYAGNLDSLAPVACHPRYHFAHADINDGLAYSASADDVPA